MYNDVAWDNLLDTNLMMMKICLLNYQSIRNTESSSSLLCSPPWYTSTDHGYRYLGKRPQNLSRSLSTLFCHDTDG